MKKIAFDTNIVLDAICNRNDAEIAQQLFMEVAEERAVGVITANAVTDIYYIARKYIGSEHAAEAIKNLMILFDIAAVDAEICAEAVYSMMDDFEDAVFAYACKRVDVDFIVTRDKGLLESSFRPVETHTPDEALRLIADKEI